MSVNINIICVVNNIIKFGNKRRSKKEEMGISHFGKLDNRDHQRIKVEVDRHSRVTTVDWCSAGRAVLLIHWYK